MYVQHCNYKENVKWKPSITATPITVSDNTKDSDNDGVNDADELCNGSDPIQKNDTTTDTDNDGLTDYIELYITKTDEKKQDTDNLSFPIF